MNEKKKSPPEKAFFTPFSSLGLFCRVARSRAFTFSSGQIRAPFRAPTGLRFGFYAAFRKKPDGCPVFCFMI
jgi:hypothetical protein